MKQIKSWKSIALAALLSLLITLQPAVTYASEVCSHCGG